MLTRDEFRVTALDKGGALVEHPQSRRVFEIADSQLPEFYRALENPAGAPREWKELLRRFSSRPPSQWDELRYWGRLTVPVPHGPQQWLHRGRRGLVARLAIAGGALIALMAGLRVGISVDALAGPRAGGGVGLLLALTVLASLTHEAGHIAVLASFGRRSDAMGVNVVFAFFHFDSDVTDLWTLRRSARLFVVLAGPLLSLAVAGIYALLAVPAVGDCEWALTRAAVMTTVAGLANLLPVEGLDGRALFEAWRGHPPHLTATPTSKVRRWLRLVPLVVGGAGAVLFLRLLVGQ